MKFVNIDGISYYYFFRPEDWLSNFHDGGQEFHDNYQVIFATSEQYFHYAKAFLFNDSKIQKAIQDLSYIYRKESKKGDRSSYISKESKRLGRLVKSFNQSVWDEKKEEIMIQGLYFKFDQIKHLKEKLIATKDAILVEGSPYDNIWGIGISIKDAINGKPWKGQNLLGKCLMKVRATFINDIYNTEKRKMLQSQFLQEEEIRKQDEDKRKKMLEDEISYFNKKSKEELEIQYEHIMNYNLNK